MHTGTAIQIGPKFLPACDVCGRMTRLVGLEQDVSGKGGEVATYQCLSCANVQAQALAPVGRSR